MKKSSYIVKSYCSSSIYLLIENENIRHLVVLVSPYSLFSFNKACQWDTWKTNKSGLLKQISSKQKELSVRERCAFTAYQEGTAWW